MTHDPDSDKACVIESKFWYGDANEPFPPAEASGYMNMQPSDFGSHPEYEIDP